MIFCKTVQARVVIYGKQIDNDDCEPAIVIIILHCICRIFFFFYIFGTINFYTPRFKKSEGVYWFTSACSSVHPSVSVCPFILFSS